MYSHIRILSMCRISYVGLCKAALPSLCHVLTIKCEIEFSAHTIESSSELLPFSISRAAKSGASISKWPARAFMHVEHVCLLVCVRRVFACATTIRAIYLYIAKFAILCENNIVYCNKAHTRRSVALYASRIPNNGPVPLKCVPSINYAVFLLLRNGWGPGCYANI